jgi:hypothetical protein
MKGSGFGLIIGVLAGLWMQFARWAEGGILLTAGVIVICVFIGYGVDMLIYIIGPYKVDRRFEEVTHR